MAQNGLIWQWLTGTVLAILMFSAAGCAQKLAFGEPNIPDSGTMAGPVSYRALSTIPAKPPIAPPEMNKQAMDGLDADRETTTKAANQLRDAPFDMPAPAPPPVEITP